MTSNKQKTPDKSRDHYVPETYLKHFSDHNKPGFIHRYHKNNPNNCKLTSTKSVCCNPGGDYNPYFKNNRPLDQYFKHIENSYNAALRDFENHNYNEAAKLCIARNVARMRLWTQKRKELVKTAWEMDFEESCRMLANDLQRNPEKYQEVLEHVRKASKNPSEINAQTMAKDLEEPSIKLTVDPHFSNEGLIEDMAKAGFLYSQMPWSIIHNTTSKPFITSDNPVCTLEMNEGRFNKHTNIYVPLTPRLAILIHITPQVNLRLKSIFSQLQATEESVEKLNSYVVKFADKYIIANAKEDWIKDLVKKFQNDQEHYREEIVTKGFDEGRNYEIRQIKFSV